MPSCYGNSVIHQTKFSCHQYIALIKFRKKFKKLTQIQQNSMCSHRHSKDIGMNRPDVAPILDMSEAVSRPVSPSVFPESREDASYSLANNITKPIQKLPPNHPEVQKWFQSVDTRNVGKINAKELQQAFEVFQGKHFSDGVCKFVVRLFDLDKNGGLDVREFEQLYFYVKQWVNAFNSYDRGRSGFLDENEFVNALKHMDINFSPEFVKFLITKTDPNCKKISLDQFIVTCVQIQKFTDEFKARDEKFSGSISLKYEDFLEMILKCVT